MCDQQLFSGIRKHVKKLREAPFDVIRQRLAELDATSKQGVEDKNILDAYRDYLFKEARGAYIEREARIVSLSMEDKGVDILSVSAREYSLCTDVAELAEEDGERPSLTPEATGLPRLRRYLFHLPAQTNYRTLHYHVFETLPDIVTRVQRILEKFDGDEGYTQMRKYFAEQLPIIRSSIGTLAKRLPRERVLKPFDEGSSKSHIMTGLKGVVQALASPIVYYPTFTKMLKENAFRPMVRDLDSI